MSVCCTMTMQKKEFECDGEHDIQTWGMLRCVVLVKSSLEGT